MKSKYNTELPWAVVLMSGGLDSCVTAAIASQNYRVAGMHVSYGQRTDKREKRSFEEITKQMGIEKTIEFKLDFMKDIGASSLTDSSLPIPSVGEIKGGIPSTYVPFRNGVLLAVATAWAEAIGAKAVFIGAVAPDVPDGYPDTSQEFFEAFERAVEIGTKPETHIKILAPLARKEKSEVVKLGVELNAPLHLTWSCYQNEERACGKCLSCVGRLEAFRKAGLKDLIPYETI